MNQLIAICGTVAALVWGGNAFAQNGGGGGGGGGGGFGGGGFGGRNFDPAQMQQRMMDGIRDRLDFTNDTDWSAVQPLVQKVMDARRDVGGGGMGAMFRNRNRGGNDQGGNNRPRNPLFGQPSPEAEALQNAIDNNAPSSQIQALLSKYRASQTAKEAKLKAAQENLRAVLSPKQEAQAALMGLVD